MASDDPTEMFWELRWVGRPVETHFSAGGSSPLARGDGTNRLETHATLGPSVDDEARERAATILKVAVGIAAGVALTIVALKAAPRIKSRLNDLRAKRSRSSVAVDAASEGDASEMVALSSTAAADFSSEVDVALDDRRTTMSSAEAQKRLCALLMAAAFIADQIRELASARIEDGDAVLDLRIAMEKLTAPQVTEHINRMLEADSSLLDEETSAEFIEIFGGGWFVDGRYVPLRNETIKEALRLTRDDAEPRPLEGEVDGLSERPGVDEDS